MPPAARPSAADSGERGAASRRRSPGPASPQRRVLHFVSAAWSVRRPRAAEGAAGRRRHFVPAGASRPRPAPAAPLRRLPPRHPPPAPPSPGTRPPRSRRAPAIAAAPTPPSDGRGAPSRERRASVPRPLFRGRDHSRRGEGPTAPRRQEAKRPVLPAGPRPAPASPPAPLGCSLRAEHTALLSSFLNIFFRIPPFFGPPLRGEGTWGRPPGLVGAGCPAARPQ